MNTRQLFLRFMPTLLSFPLGGLIVRLTIGSIDTSIKALIGGLVVGAVVGLIQFISLQPLQVSTSWIIGTAVALGFSSYVVAMTLGFDTSSVSLAEKGALTGISVGLVQSLIQKFNKRNFLLWSFANGCTWALAWFITSRVIVDAEYGYAIFGSSGALVLTVILALVLQNIFQIKSKSAV